jgi:hypothetical protein
MDALSTELESNVWYRLLLLLSAEFLAATYSGGRGGTILPTAPWTRAFCRLDAVDGLLLGTAGMGSTLSKSAAIFATLSADASACMRCGVAGRTPEADAAEDRM